MVGRVPLGVDVAYVAGQMVHLEGSGAQRKEVRAVLVRTHQNIIVLAQFLWGREPTHPPLETRAFGLEMVDENGIAEDHLLVSADAAQPDRSVVLTDALEVGQSQADAANHVANLLGGELLLPCPA